MSHAPVPVSTQSSGGGSSGLAATCPGTTAVVSPRRQGSIAFKVRAGEATISSGAMCLRSSAAAFRSPTAPIAVSTELTVLTVSLRAAAGGKSRIPIRKVSHGAFMPSK